MIDSILRTPVGLEAFVGDHAVRIELRTSGPEPVAEPVPLYEAWPGLPFARIDAAFASGKNVTYFFSGDRYARADTASRRLLDGARPIRDHWSVDHWHRLPAGWDRDYDDVTYWSGNGKAWFFKHNDYLRYDLAADHVDKSTSGAWVYPLPLTAHWKLPFATLDAFEVVEGDRALAVLGDEWAVYDVRSHSVLDGGTLADWHMPWSAIEPPVVEPSDSGAPTSPTPGPGIDPATIVLTGSGPPAPDAPVRLLHLSDMHFVSDDTRNEPLRKRLAYIAENYPDHYVVITGDIVDNEGAVPAGTPTPIVSEPTLATMSRFVGFSFADVDRHLPIHRKALENARRALLVLPPERIYLIAGNHDVALWGNFYHEAYGRAFDDLLWRPIMSGKMMLRSPPVPSGVAKSLLGYHLPRISLWAVNTCPDLTTPSGSLTGTLEEHILKNSVLASGMVGGTQLAQLQSQLHGQAMIPNHGATLGFATLVMWHHHPFRHGAGEGRPAGPWDKLKLEAMYQALRLQDADDLMKALHGGADLCLFGHRHVAHHYSPGDASVVGIKYGALASGSTRVDTRAWEVSVGPTAAISISQVPIV